MRLPSNGTLKNDLASVGFQHDRRCWTCIAAETTHTSVARHLTQPGPGDHDCSGKSRRCRPEHWHLGSPVRHDGSMFPHRQLIDPLQDVRPKMVGEGRGLELDSYNSNTWAGVGISTMVPERRAANCFIASSSPWRRNVRFAPVCFCQLSNPVSKPSNARVFPVQNCSGLDKDANILGKAAPSCQSRSAAMRKSSGSQAAKAARFSAE
jgi:hypothetical protein